MATTAAAAELPAASHSAKGEVHRAVKVGRNPPDLDLLIVARFKTASNTLPNVSVFDRVKRKSTKLLFQTVSDILRVGPKAYISLPQLCPMTAERGSVLLVKLTYCLNPTLQKPHSRL